MGERASHTHCRKDSNWLPGPRGGAHRGEARLSLHFEKITLSAECTCFGGGWRAEGRCVTVACLAHGGQWG